MFGPKQPLLDGHCCLPPGRPCLCPCPWPAPLVRCRWEDFDRLVAQANRELGAAFAERWRTHRTAVCLEAISVLWFLFDTLRPRSPGIWRAPGRRALTTSTGTGARSMLPI